MLYSQADRDTVIAKVKQRSLVVWIPTAVLLALAILSFIGFRLRHDESGWIISALFTILGGGYCIFFYGVYLQPVRKYKKHLDYMLDGNKRETEGVLKEISDVVLDKEGLDCYSVMVNIGERDDPEDDRLFYLDVFKSISEFKIGDRVHIESNDRMIASIAKA